MTNPTIPPLPFNGKKSDKARRETITDSINQYVKHCEINGLKPVFVDVHAGSGYVSHLIKAKHPDSLVIANDFDHNKTLRYAHAHETERLRQTLKAYYPRKTIPSVRDVSLITSLLSSHVKQYGYLDILTLSRWLVKAPLYTLKLDGLLYNIDIVRVPARPVKFEVAHHYFDNINVIHEDASDYNHFIQHVSQQFNLNITETFWFFDPPYVKTNCSDYTGEGELFDANHSIHNFETVRTLNTFAYFNSSCFASKLDLKDLNIKHFTTRAGYGFTRDFIAQR